MPHMASNPGSPVMLGTLNTADTVTWPPVSMMAVYAKMSEWAAWYSGEPARIIAMYAMNNASTQLSPWWRFWSRAREGARGAQRAVLHVPIASDLAATSAALLFGQPPVVRIREARVQGEDCNEGDEAGSGMPMRAAMKPQTAEQRTEARLQEIIEGADVFGRLVEAAESAAAIGGVYIYPVWDPDLRPYPLLGIAQPDMAVPEFRHGILTAVTFHRTVQQDGNKLVRHLERHEVVGTGADRHCVIYNGLYQGTEDRLGIQMGLGVGDYLSGHDIEPVIHTPFTDLDVEYVPNMRPNRLWRATGFGVADIQGSEGLLDALDETYASWMRDIRLAKARILVPREYLRNDPYNNNQPSFDPDQEVYVPLDIDQDMGGQARQMLAHQFAIRWEEHRETSRELISHIVSNAGYDPGTLGISTEKGTGTGTALRISEHKTLLTLRRKQAWWQSAVANTLYRMQLADREYFGQTYPALRPAVKISDSIIDDPLQLAQTVLALKTAEAASTETRVRIVHPDWSELEVAAEVERITDERPAPAVSTGGFAQPKQPADPGSDDGQFGNPAGMPRMDSASGGTMPMAPQMRGTPPNHEPPASPPMARDAH